MRDLEAALKYYAKKNWAIFPAPPGEKKSHKAKKNSINGANWGATRDQNEIRVDFKRWPDANTGIPTGLDNGFFVVEADTPKGHGVDGIAGLQALEAANSPLPPTLMAMSPSGSVHRYYKHPGNGIKIKNSASEIAPGVDVRGDGGMVIAPPSERQDGCYHWLNDLPIVDAPLWLLELVINRRAEREPTEPREKQAQLFKIIAAVAVIPNDDNLGWEEWNKRGMAIWAATGGSDDGLQIFDFWSKKWCGYNQEDTTAKWDELHKTPPTDIGAGSVFHWASEACPRWEILACERPGTIAAQMTEIAEIANLAMKPEIFYERVRNQVAKQLNMRVSKLDEIVSQLRVSVKQQFIENSRLFEMNLKHCVLPLGGKTRVATWGEDPDFPGRSTIIRFATFLDFQALFDKYRHTYESEGKTVDVGVGTWWISQPNRRQYDNGMRFMPTSGESVVNGTLNLWQGFAVEARKPEGKSGAEGCKLFLDHGLKIICGGDEEHYNYMMKREAFIAQRRTRSEIAIGLQTEIEGSGKGIWCGGLNHLYGIHAMEVQNPEHVVGKHNPHLEKLLRLTADEALFAPNPKHRDALYHLITEPTITIEPKFIDPYRAPNYLNIDIISNASHFLPVSGTARRFFVPNVSAERANDREYFRKMLTELHDGGYEALLYHLLHEIDVRDFDVRAVPKTASLAEQAAYSRKGIDLLVETACQEGLVPCQAKGRPGASVVADYNDGRTRGFDTFIDHHPDRTLALLGALKVKRRLAEDWGCITGKAGRIYVEGGQRYCLLWPSLPELRAKFEAKHGTQAWVDPDLTEWQDADPF